MKKRVLSWILVLSLFCALDVPALAAVEDTGYADVDAGVWYAGAVQYCRGSGLMSGMSDTVFGPNEAASRAMLVSILHRQAGSPEAGQASFPDVAIGSWYSGAVNWAAANGVVSGYSDGRFGPDDLVTREQLAAILWRAAGSPAARADLPFADQNAISAYAINGVAWARAQGIVSGRSGNRFDPQGNATRAELAAMLYRWIGGQTAPEPEAPPAADRGKVLVAYFSRTGTTRSVAELVAERIGGDLFEIVPEQAYPTEYNACLQQARQELADNARPALASQVIDMDQYDVIILGFPIWHGDTPMPIRTFLESYQMAGKTIAPFSTSGSSGIGSAMESIRALCPDSTVSDGLSIPSGSMGQAKELIGTWVTNLLLSTEKEGEEAMPKLAIQVGGRPFTATLQDNAAARALVERLPMTVTMDEMNGNEKYFFMQDGLPVNAERPGNIQTGDFMLYGSDCLVIFYENFSSSYSYTRLGKIDDPTGLAEALGKGSVEVTLRLN